MLERVLVDTFFLPIGLLLGLAAWIALVQFLRHEQTRRQREIFSRGACCVGKVVAIQRPSVVDTCTRLYFDFEPPEADRPLRVCHVDRGAAGQLPSTLPYIGQMVSVRYLREQPQQALISNLF